MEIFDRLGCKWAVKPIILKDIYLMMRHDRRFRLPRSEGNPGIKYKKVQKHLEDAYRIHTVNERQLRYLVKCIEDGDT